MELEKCTGIKDRIIKDSGLRGLKMEWVRYGIRAKLYKKDSMKMVN
jgi:hypothetical protein